MNIRNLSLSSSNANCHQGPTIVLTYVRRAAQCFPLLLLEFQNFVEKKNTVFLTKLETLHPINVTCVFHVLSFCFPPSYNVEFPIFFVNFVSTILETLYDS